MTNKLDTYLLNQIQGASPEEMQTMLLNKASLFVKELITVLEYKQYIRASELTTKIVNIIEHLVHYLIPNESELTINLLFIYMQWNSVLFTPRDPELKNKLEIMITQMTELAETWRQYSLKKRLK